MALNAITRNATGRVIEWGAGVLRAAGSGETAYVDVISVESQSVIDSVGPRHTKVEANAFVEMTQSEKDAVDAILSSNLDITSGRVTVGYATPGQSGSSLNYSGLYASSMLDASSNTGADEWGRYFKGDSDGTIGNDTGAQLAKTVHQRRYNFECVRKFSLQQTADLRFWCSMATTLTIGNILSYDEPPESYVGVRYSTDASDTTFRFMSRNAGTTNNVDSGVTVTTDVFYIRISSDESVPNFTIAIFDASFMKLASHIFTTNIPGAATTLGCIVAFEPRAASVMSIKQYYWAGINKA